MNLDRVLSLRRKLHEDLTLQLSHCSPEGQNFPDFVNIVAQLLPKKVSREALNVTLRPLAGVVLTDPVIDDLSWRLAGNLKLLLSGRPILPWCGLTKPEWVHAIILEAWPQSQWVQVSKEKQLARGSQDRVERPGGRVLLRVCTGPPAGQTFMPFWSWAFVRHYRIILGFARFDREYIRGDPGPRPYSPLRDWRELTRLRIKVLAEPVEDSFTLCEANFIEIAEDAGCRRHNRNLLEQRRRPPTGLQRFNCPLNYSLDEVPCYRCEAGYDRCPAACHPRTYSRGLCCKCHRQSWFDPANPEKCVDCRK